MSPGNVHFYFPIVTCLLLRDRKSTRLNSSHGYNLVCRLLLEKKKLPTIREQVTISTHAHRPLPLRSRGGHRDLHVLCSDFASLICLNASLLYESQWISTILF